MLVDGIPVAEFIYNENVKTESMIEISTGILENLYQHFRIKFVRQYKSFELL